MRGYPEFLKKYACADFPLILWIKTAVLKMFSLYTLKISLDLNNSLVCSNLLSLKMMQRACFL